LILPKTRMQWMDRFVNKIAIASPFDTPFVIFFPVDLVHGLQMLSPRSV
jgi:uncharacterized protein involved in tolerance to divalent cations